MLRKRIDFVVVVDIRFWDSREEPRSMDHGISRIYNYNYARHTYSMNTRSAHTRPYYASFFVFRTIPVTTFNKRPRTQQMRHMNESEKKIF